MSGTHRMTAEVLRVLHNRERETFLDTLKTRGAYIASNTYEPLPDGYADQARRRHEQARDWLERAIAVYLGPEPEKP